jgi:hypothetical protein
MRITKLLETIENPIVNIPNNVDVLYKGPTGLLASPNTKQAFDQLSQDNWKFISNDFDGYNDEGPIVVWLDKNGSNYCLHLASHTIVGPTNRYLSQSEIQQLRQSNRIIDGFCKDYESNLLQRNPFPMGIVSYAREFKGQWPEAERVLLNPSLYHNDGEQAEVLMHYIKNTTNKRWPEAEKFIMADPMVADEYQRDILKMLPAAKSRKQ